MKQSLSPCCIWSSASMVLAAATAVLLQPTMSFAQKMNCYDNTSDILQAQLSHPPILDFVLCPRTVFPIGVPVPTVNDNNIHDDDDNNLLSKFTMVNGDYPLVALHNNVTFQCGLDGSFENQCVLLGGSGVVNLWTPPPLTTATTTTHNLRVQGLTFTGELSTTTDTVNPTPVVSLGAPGNNMVLEDCVFVDILADVVVSNIPFDLVLGTVADASTESSSLLIRNTAFRNIQYHHHLLQNQYQTMNLENLELQNVQWTNHLEYDDHLDMDPPAIIHIEDAVTHMVDTSFEDISLDSFTPVVLVKGETSVFEIHGTTAKNVVWTENSSHDENSGCGGRFMMQRFNGDTNFDCHDVFDPIWNDSEEKDRPVVIKTRLTATLDGDTPSPAPTPEGCFGICGLEAILSNPDEIASISETMENPTCGELNDGILLLSAGTSCRVARKGAIQAGCTCVSLSTISPTTSTLAPTSAPMTTPTTTTNTTTTLAPSTMGVNPPTNSSIDSIRTETDGAPRGNAAMMTWTMSVLLSSALLLLV